jgi:methylmalonyl-CoA/ethylmalonyl-CoA epimerase
MEKHSTHQVQLKSVDQIGVVVRDIDKTIASWSKLFGLSPWIFRDFSAGDVKGRPIKGRLAFAHLGPVQLELIQPVEGLIFYSEFLDKHGEGLHHLGFFVDDLEGEVNNLLAQGARVLSSGAGTYAYLDTGGPGGIIFELIRKDVMAGL